MGREPAAKEAAKASGRGMASGQGRQRQGALHTTSPQLRDLRQTRVVVLMPDDADRLALMQQLQRIGVDAHVAWPPLPSLPEGTDVVFLTVQPETLMLRPPWIEGREAPALIAVVGYESPTIVSAVLAPAVSTGR